MRENKTFYGIGVGPGDPELIPVKSVNILKSVDIIFAASSSKNNHSRAVDIAKSFIPKNTDIKILKFPMTKDEKEKQKAWCYYAKEIISCIKSGKSAAFLTLGDPLIYATYGYIVKNIQIISPEIKIKTIPGITSFQAAAALTNRPLVEGEESLVILSGVEGGQHIHNMSNCADNMVVMKAYKNIKDILKSLSENNLLKTSIGVVNCCMKDEEVIEDIRELEKRKPNYWTLILAKKEKNNEK